MMADGKDMVRLESRIGAVHAVSGIVRAIWALSRAQLAQVDALARESSAYLDGVDAIVARLAGAPHASQGVATLRVVMGPERGFCGALARRVTRALRGDRALGVVGRRLHERVQAEPELAQRVVFAIEGPSSVDDIEDVARAVAAQVLSHGAGRQVELCYPRVRERGLDCAVLLAGARTLIAFADFETLSAPERVLEAAVAESVVSRVRVGLLEALRAEVRARAEASEAARRAVDQQLGELSAVLRVLQQEAITNELCELTGARMATGEGA